MSLAGDRAAIAAAVDAVADVQGYDEPPAMMSVGDAWVRWAGFEAAGPPLTFTTTWKIDVITGGAPQDAMIWLDAHLASILDAIDHLVYVDGVVPVEFQIPNSGVLYGAEITAH